MSGKCKICGYQAGIFNLKDGKCKSCFGTDIKNTDGYNQSNEIQSFTFSASQKKSFLWLVTFISIILIILFIQHMYLNEKAENEYQEYILITPNPPKFGRLFITRGSIDNKTYVFDPASGRNISKISYFKNKDQIVKVSPTNIKNLNGSFSWRLFECGLMCFLR